MRNEFLSLQIPLPIAIVGTGLSGESVKKLLLGLGVDSDQIFTFDQKSPADFQDPEKLLQVAKPKSLCVSPGVPLKQDWIQKAIQSGLRLTSELEIAFSFVTTEKVICITGAVGKSTTTSILGAAVSKVDSQSFVGGNLGFPLADYAYKLICENRPKAQYLVLELSSYQLENFRNLKSHVSVLTHLSPNHLERYRDLNHYFETKLELFKMTTELGLLNRSGGYIASLLDRIQATNPKLKWHWTDRNDPQFKKSLSSKPLLVGSHNLDNLSLAFAVAKHFSWPDKSYQAMLQFPGLSHRLENCGSHQGILFLNDSKATTIESVLQAVQSVRQEYQANKMHLLIGGKDKNLPWENLGKLKNATNLVFTFFGEVAPVAQNKSQLPGKSYPTLAECLKSLKPQLASGDIVLLSPGGTSWDEFNNFEERGQFFKNWLLSEFQNSKT